MNTQINLRLPENMLKSAKSYADQHGFSTIQEFIKETIREKLYNNVTKDELNLIKQFAKITKERNLYGTEEELFKILQKKN